MSDDPFDRLEAAIVEGDQRAIAAWAATGWPGLLVLRDVLDGTRRPARSSEMDARVAIDNTTIAVGAIAAAHPDAYLEVFADRRFVTNSIVLGGLGKIDDPRATERLVVAATARDRWERMEAAMGLGRRVAPEASDALVGLLGDAEFLVRIHAIKSLGKVGDERALPALRRLARPSPYEGAEIDAASEAIETRASARGTSR